MAGFCTEDNAFITDKVRIMERLLTYYYYRGNPVRPGQRYNRSTYLYTKQ
jgi:hypothetical protein